jgi:exodeoxyribonuclease-5
MLTEIHRQAEGNPIIDLATRVRRGDALPPGQYGTSIVLRGKPDPSMVLGCDQVIVGTNKTRRFCNQKIRDLRGFGGDLPVAGERVVCLRNNHDVGILNGTLWNVVEASSFSGLHQMSMKLESDGQVVDVSAHTQHFLGEELPYWGRKDAEEFDFGYAMTCHKAQGSGWPSVCVFDESWIARANRREWLYTAITRAAQRVVICQ